MQKWLKGMLRWRPRERERRGLKKKEEGWKCWRKKRDVREDFSKKMKGKD